MTSYFMAYKQIRNNQINMHYNIFCITSPTINNIIDYIIKHQSHPTLPHQTRITSYIIKHTNIDTSTGSVIMHLAILSDGLTAQELLSIFRFVHRNSTDVYSRIRLIRDTMIAFPPTFSDTMQVN